MSAAQLGAIIGAVASLPGAILVIASIVSRVEEFDLDIGTSIGVGLAIFAIVVVGSFLTAIAATVVDGWTRRG